MQCIQYIFILTYSQYPKILMRYFLSVFHTKSSKPAVYFILSTHLNLSETVQVLCSHKCSSQSSNTVMLNLKTNI